MLLFISNIWRLIRIPRKNQKTGFWIHCDQCNEMIYRTPYQYKIHKHHFCSKECEREFSHSQKSETRHCEFCGAEMVVGKKSRQRFCSTSCQKEWQKTIVGDKNPRYTSVPHICDYCGKEHIVKPYRLKQKNLFCSTECRRSWYANIWSQSEEWKTASKERAVNLLSSGIMSRTNSVPQQHIDDLLKQMGINFRKEYPLSTYSIDNYLLDYGLCIEVMGDFWHANPNKYTTIKYDKQAKAVARDAQKRITADKLGKPILYLWENEIINNLTLCQKLIEKFINRGGVLENYHSFNYILNDIDVEIIENPILAYQDYDADNLETLLFSA
jgi:G:T-mismatch repair DNA endonuclease (very short patch repair protein)